MIWPRGKRQQVRSGSDASGRCVQTQLHLTTVAQMGKNLPAMQETRVPSLGREDPLEEEMATHSSVLAWRIPRTEEPGEIESLGSQRVGHN